MIIVHFFLSLFLFLAQSLAYLFKLNVCLFSWHYHSSGISWWIFKIKIEFSRLMLLVLTWIRCLFDFPSKYIDEYSKKCVFPVLSSTRIRKTFFFFYIFWVFFYFENSQIFPFAVKKRVKRTRKATCFPPWNLCNFFDLTQKTLEICSNLIWISFVFFILRFLSAQQSYGWINIWPNEQPSTTFNMKKHQNVEIKRFLSTPHHHQLCQDYLLAHFIFCFYDTKKKD